MKALIFLTIALLFSPLPLWSQTEAEKGYEIAKRSAERNTGFEDYITTWKMTLISGHGEETVRQMRVKFLEGKEDGDKNLIYFESPPDVKGTAMLTFNHRRESDEQWLFLPALQRVKRISASNKSGPFMGSEFTYEDLTTKELSKFTYRWLRDEKYEGQDCHVLETTPLDPDSGYTKMISWVDKAESRDWRIEYYDRKNSHLKTLILSNYTQYINKVWRAADMHMENHQSGKKTILHSEDFHFKTGLKDSDFSQNSLKR